MTRRHLPILAVTLFAMSVSGCTERTISKPGAPSAAKPPQTQDYDSAVIVDSIRSSGGSKYHWQQARLLKVLTPDPALVLNDTIEFAHLNTEPDVPDGQWVLYLKRMDSKPSWWRLIKYEATP